MSIRQTGRRAHDGRADRRDRLESPWGPFQSCPQAGCDEVAASDNRVREPYLRVRARDRIAFTVPPFWRFLWFTAALLLVAALVVGVTPALCGHDQAYDSRLENRFPLRGWEQTLHGGDVNKANDDAMKLSSPVRLLSQTAVPFASLTDIATAAPSFSALHFVSDQGNADAGGEPATASTVRSETPAAGQNATPPDADPPSAAVGLEASTRSPPSDSAGAGSQPETTPTGQTNDRVSARTAGEGGPQQLLELYGIDESQLRLIRDDTPLGTDDEETLERFLYRIPRFPLFLLERWGKEPGELSDWLESPINHRADARRVEGRVVLVEKRELSMEAASRYEFEQYYVVTLQPTDSGLRWLICTREIPVAWPIGETMNEPAAAVGLFFKVGPSPGGKTDLVLVSPRVAWYPEQTQPTNGLSADQIVLARLGMDIGLWDTVTGLQRKPIQAEDREAFFQLMRAVSRSRPGQLAGPLRRGVEFAPLLQDPLSQQGRFATVEGTVRRIAKVHIEEPELQERFGLKHYFQVDMFVPLDRLSIRLGENAVGQEGPAFNNTYPVTICVLKLPAGVREGDDLDQFLRVQAVFFKLWAYRSEYMSSFDDRQLQIGPLMIGLEPEWVPRPQPPTAPWGPMIIVLFGFSLLLVWFSAIRWSRSDKKFEQSVMRRQFEPEGGQSLNDVGLQARSGPDFSHLPTRETKPESKPSDNNSV